MDSAKICACLVVAIGVVVAAPGGFTDQPAYPVWPNQFTQNLTDHNDWPTGWYATPGTMYYDWTTKQFRLDRQNGRYDRYCGTNGVYEFYDTPCSQYVDTAGDRYLYYPQYDDCCFCCNAKHGCGIVYPYWMQGAEFLGNVTVSRKTAGDIPAFYWDQVGGQDNYYWETQEEEPTDRIMLEIFMSPNEKQVYAPHRLNTVDPDALVLPSACVHKKGCSVASVCEAVQPFRESMGTDEEFERSQ